MQERIRLRASKTQSFKVSGDKRNYILLNIIFAGIIICIITYSGFFSAEKDNYPVQCLHETLSGQPCPSCGLSRSFSYIIRGKLEEASLSNVYGIRVFLFLVAQLIMRLSNLVYLRKEGGSIKQLARYDISLSIVLFIAGFSQFIQYYTSLIF